MTLKVSTGQVPIVDRAVRMVASLSVKGVTLSWALRSSMKL